jgi:hypothetical protein
VCFSAAASFGVGAALVPAGGYCIWAACVKKPRFLALAAVPFFFGVQQISEGFVWHALEHGDAEHARAPALFFLFFALAFWPFWFPFLTMTMETCRKRRWIFLGLTLGSTIWFWVLFYPIASGPDSLLKIQEHHHSIQYDYYDGLAIYQYVPRLLLQVLYLATIALPMVFGSNSWGRIPGLILGISAVFAAVVFEYAFVSVWCFFAAVLAVYLIAVFYRLPQPELGSPADDSV